MKEEVFIDDKSKKKIIDRIVFFLFSILAFYFVAMGLTGRAWIIISAESFSLWFIVLTIFLAISASAVATYSFVAYSQSKELQQLMLILLGFNIVLWSILYLLTHPSTEAWSLVYSNRDRNRTMGIALVLIIIPVILLNSFSGEKRSNKRLTSLLVIWGAGIMPIMSLWFFFSPNPIFQMTSEQGGIEGLTQIGMVISFGYLISQILAFIRFAVRWKKTKNTIDLALTLFLALLLIGTVFIIVLWNPLQIAELLWMATIVSGFILIAVVLFTTSIIEPQRIMEYLVEQRTREVVISKRESEFYLGMWTHKMGNLLQGLSTYLDILEHAAQYGEDDRKTRALARDLSREARMVNQQVSQLSKVKESVHYTLWPIRIIKILKDAARFAEEQLGENSFGVQYDIVEDIIINADNLLHLVFQSLFSFHVKNRIDEMPLFKISVELGENTKAIIFTSRGKNIPDELRMFIESEEQLEKIALDLDLFTAKLLLTRYQAKVRCSRNEEKSENSCRIIFPK